MSQAIGKTNNKKGKHFTYFIATLLTRGKGFTEWKAIPFTYHRLITLFILIEAEWENS